MKYNLEGELENDLGGHGGICNVLDNVGSKPWGSRGPRPPTGWRSSERDLVVAILLGEARRTGSAAPLAKTGLGSCAFHTQLVCAALANKIFLKFSF